MAVIKVKQRTIAKEISIEGIGLHTGNKVKVCFKPAEVNRGINFVRVDVPGSPIIKADVSNVLIQAKVPRCTSVGVGDVVIHTVEHLMSVLCGLCLDNLTIELNGNEIPGLDGSGIGFLKALREAGIVEQEKERQYLDIKKPVWVERNGSSIYIVPHSTFKVSYTLDYNHPDLKAQFFSVDVEPEVFEREIAPCRTFCLESEAEELRRMGLGKGANYENTLVIGRGGVKSNKVYFDNEFARHKILDFIGDLYLLGIPIRGHAFAVKSGHRLNLALLQEISSLKKELKTRNPPLPYDIHTAKELDINGIMNILPHRYPFLLVDRVIELEQGKRAVGIKNVTINDNFFQGHFPTRPVMPGVLMIEAMAQVGGLAVLTHEQHFGQVAFFMAADNVKFRKVVIPGDQLVIEADVIRIKSKITQVHAVTKVGDSVAAEADLIFSYTSADYLA